MSCYCSSDVRLAVGSSKTDAEGVKKGPGYVRIYDFDGSEWQQIGQDLEGDSDNCRFGRKIAMSNDGTIVAQFSLQSVQVSAHSEKKKAPVIAGLD